MHCCRGSSRRADWHVIQRPAAATWLLHAVPSMSCQPLACWSHSDRPACCTHHLCCCQVKELLSRNRGALDALAAALLAKESMQGGEVYQVLEGHLSSSDKQQREEALESMAFM